MLGINPISSAAIGASAFGEATITLVAAACAQANTSTTGTITLGPVTLTLAAATCTQPNLCTAGFVTIDVAPTGAGIYAKLQDLIDRFGNKELAQLTDPAAGSTINTTTVGRALGDADAEINSRLARRYALPLAVVPTVLVRIACDLARYFLWDVRASDQVRNRFKDATALLDKIGSGAVALPEAPLLTPAATAVAVLSRTSKRQFSTSMLDAFGPPN